MNVDFTTIVVNDLERLKLHKLSRNFRRSEFACKCGCGFATADNELIEVLEMVRASFKMPVTINSGCRCLEHNEKVQKLNNVDYVPYSSKTKHMQGIAADIVVEGVEANVVYEFLCNYQPSRYGIGNYVKFTHIDVRPTKARW